MSYYDCYNALSGGGSKDCSEKENDSILKVLIVRQICFYFYKICTIESFNSYLIITNEIWDDEGECTKKRPPG